MNSCCETLRAELARVRAALEFTRDHNRKLTDENKRLREGRGLAPPDPLDAPVEVRIARDMLPPPGPIVVPVHPDLLPPPARRQERRGFRSLAYAGDLPLRNQWPVE